MVLRDVPFRVLQVGAPSHPALRHPPRRRQTRPRRPARPRARAPAPALTRRAPGQLVLFEELAHLAARRTDRPDLTLWESVGVGATAGALASGITTPLDAVGTLAPPTAPDRVASSFATIRPPRPAAPPRR
jgi:hypothetical protein